MLKNPYLITSSVVPKLMSVFINVSAIAIFPFVFFREELPSKETISHELVHFKQQKELFVILFYLIYVFDWIYGLIKYRDVKKAYYRIRFEQEANEANENTFYCIGRKNYAWLNYRI